jgi:hypothetical protein
MVDLVEVVGLRKLLVSAGLDSDTGDFEVLYDGLVSSPKQHAVALQIEDAIRDYFNAIELPDSATAYDYLLSVA